jgi:hypothetical protein
MSIIPAEITDEFLESYGGWENYDALPGGANEALRNQEHVDIRSFVPDKPATQVTMLLMDRLAMGNLDNTELGVYTSNATPPATVIVVNNEGWTYGDVGPQADRNNWNGITVNCAAEAITTTQSVITFAE